MPGFRGCPFNNASIEFHDPQHPARVQARGYREQLRGTLSRLAVQLTRGTGAGSADGESLGAQLAVLIDGAQQLVRPQQGPRGAQSGIPRSLAEVYADHIDWHQIARLVQRGCPPAAGLRIVR